MRLDAQLARSTSATHAVPRTVGRRFTARTISRSFHKRVIIGLEAMPTQLRIARPVSALDRSV